MSGSIMNAIIGYLVQNMVQKGWRSFLVASSGGDSSNSSYAGGLKSALSGNGLNSDDALLRHVQKPLAYRLQIKLHNTHNTVSVTK